MTRLLLILVMLIQLSGCTTVLETAAGTPIGTLSADAVKDKFKEYDEKEESSEPCAMPCVE